MLGVARWTALLACMPVAELSSVATPGNIEDDGRNSPVSGNDSFDIHPLDEKKVHSEVSEAVAERRMMSLPDFSSHSMTWDGHDREYFVYIPDSLRAEQARNNGAATMVQGVVLFLHGYTQEAWELCGDPAGMDEYHAMMSMNPKKHADTYKFVAVCPQGLGSMKKQGWNNEVCCGEHQDTDDVGFIGEILKTVRTKILPDAGFIYPGNDGTLTANSRPNVFAFGYSAGGLFSLRLACELSGEITGVVVSGATWNRAFKDSFPPMMWTQNCWDSIDRNIKRYIVAAGSPIHQATLTWSQSMYTTAQCQGTPAMTFELTESTVGGGCITVNGMLSFNYYCEVVNGKKRYGVNEYKTSTTCEGDYDKQDSWSSYEWNQLFRGECVARSLGGFESMRYNGGMSSAYMPTCVYTQASTNQAGPTWSQSMYTTKNCQGSPSITFQLTESTVGGGCITVNGMLSFNYYCEVVNGARRYGVNEYKSSITCEGNYDKQDSWSSDEWKRLFSGDCVARSLGGFESMRYNGGMSSGYMPTCVLGTDPSSGKSGGYVLPYMVPTWMALGSLDHNTPGPLGLDLWKGYGKFLGCKKGPMEGTARKRVQCHSFVGSVHDCASGLSTRMCIYEDGHHYNNPFETEYYYGPVNEGWDYLTNLNRDLENSKWSENVLNMYNVGDGKKTGTNGCQCIKGKGVIQRPASGEPEHAHVGRKYGYGCQAHDQQGTACTKSGADTNDGGAEDWCADQWCLVDPATCIFKTRAVSYTSRTDDYFSYETCNPNFKGNSWVGRCRCAAPYGDSFCECGRKIRKMEKAGTDGCQCIKWTGEKQRPASGELEHAHVGRKYGYGCQAHDQQGTACTKSGADTNDGGAEDWCADQWCLVDPDTCILKTRAVSYTSNTDDYFSYETCNPNFRGNNWVGRCRCAAPYGNSFCECGSTGRKLKDVAEENIVV